MGFKMHLSREQIHRISKAVIHALVEGKGIRSSVAEEKLVDRVAKVLEADQTAETELEKEVEALLQKNAQLLDQEGADWGKMFHKIKAKLAEEKGMVL
ncbi:MAG: DUF507 family protein [Deltaproteobacteria bacterium]|nr:DUF507 family protein [Deltaproteobacteria bacterium]